VLRKLPLRLRRFRADITHAHKACRQPFGRQLLSFGYNQHRRCKLLGRHKKARKRRRIRRRPRAVLHLSERRYHRMRLLMGLRACPQLLLLRAYINALLPGIAFNIRRRFLRLFRRRGDIQHPFIGTQRRHQRL